MILDILLPSVLFLIAVAIVFLYAKLEKKVDSLLGGHEFRIGHVVLLVAAIGVMVTILVFVPEKAMMVFFLFAYSTILFLFTYLLAPKWYLAVPIPVLFIALYLSPYWKGNIYLFNFFAIIFAVCISVYMGSLFAWKTTAAFVALLTIMDIIQVLITGHMVTSSEKAITLGLPIAIILPTFPYEGWTFLGLGDVFLFGLLSIQTTQKYGKKIGLASIVSMTVVFFLLLTILLNTGVESFPATVLVISGWLISLGARYLYKSHMFMGVKNE
jgi:presenilin-like A22 family membrane protease